MAANKKKSKLIIKILKNIIEEPNNVKYHKINYKKIKDKLKNCADLIEILYSAGFKESDDNEKLIFHPESSDSAKLIYNELTSRLVINDFCDYEVVTLLYLHRSSKRTFTRD